MRNFLTLWRKELVSYFISPAAYVTMIVILCVSGYAFWGHATLSLGESVKLDVMLFQPLTLWVIIVAAILTMRLFAEEKRSGTIESLMTAPVTEAQVVLGKYAAALTVFVTVFTPTVAYVFILRRFSSGIELIDPGSMIGGYLVFLLIGSFYVSIGLLASALSKSQVVSAITSLTVLFVIFSVGVFSRATSGHVAAVLEYVSAVEHVLDFSRGTIDTRPVVLYLSGIALVLFSAVRVLESRRWI